MLRDEKSLIIPSQRACPNFGGNPEIFLFSARIDLVPYSLLSAPFRTFAPPFHLHSYDNDSIQPFAHPYDPSPCFIIATSSRKTSRLNASTRQKKAQHRFFSHR